MPVLNVYEKLLYVDTCRYDLHIPKELRQHYLRISENTTTRQPNDYKLQGQFNQFINIPVYYKWISSRQILIGLAVYSVT